MRTRFRWEEPRETPPDRVAALRSALSLPEEVARLLVLRGHDDPEAARAFLRPDPAALHPPEALPDLAAAVERVEAAISAGERVLVHGDYDVDGLCAAALLALGLEELGARVATFVPHRTRDGYDLGPAGLRRAREIGAGLVVTADCGTSAVGAVERAAAAGMDVVVTDHHRPGPGLPPASAVVNPHREDSGYPFPGLAGAGVAFKLLAALFRRRGLPPERLNRHLDLVALGTVADRVPLVDENRILVRMGLAALGRTRKVGLRGLAREAGLRSEAPVTATDVGFGLGPRLNAAGRLGSPEEALRLLLTDDPEEARVLARRLELHNRRRRDTDREVWEDAAARLRSEFEPERDRVVVLWGEGWHPGVLGLAASRIADRVHRPTVLVSFDGEVGRGSARSIEGFHLYRALEACGGTLERFGGHAMAAGLDVRRERVEAFADELSAYAAEVLSADDLVRRLRIDLRVRRLAAAPELAGRLEWLAPFGTGNPRPVLACAGLELREARRVGRDGAHLRAELASPEARLPAIGFGLGERAAELGSGRRWEAAFHLEEERWDGRSRLQARLLDFRPSG